VILKRKSRKKKSVSKKSRKSKGRAKKKDALTRKLVMKKALKALTVSKRKPTIFREDIGKTIDKRKKFGIKFTINTGNFHDDLGVFSSFVYEIDKEMVKGIKVTYKITKGTLPVEIILYALGSIALGVIGNQISRIINRIRDRREIEKLRISVESKEILARQRLEQEKIGEYRLSEPDRIRDFHNWTVTRANGMTFHIIVFDNGEIHLSN